MRRVPGMTCKKHDDYDRENCPPCPCCARELGGVVERAKLTAELRKLLTRMERGEHVCLYAGGRNGGKPSAHCRCEIDGLIR